MKKVNDGAFIFIAGRPYRYNNIDSFANYNYIIDYWLTNSPLDIDEGISAPLDYSLSQNYPIRLMRQLISIIRLKRKVLYQ